MFNSARLKLTAWYLLLIMLISAAFSVVIYEVQTSELERFVLSQRFRIERRLRDADPTLPPPTIIDPELVAETEYRLALFLIVINGGILVLSGGVGFFLAGRTLQPIAEMMEEQNRFISDASHELRTPLTSLKSALEVHLRDKHPTLSDSRKLINDSLGEVNKLQLLSEGLLKLTQYQKPQPIKFTSLTLLEIADEAVRQIEPLARQKQIRIENNAENFKLAGDRYALINLTTTLLDNAVKYSPAKSQITLDCQKTDGRIILKIADQGPGIDPKDLPHIFDRFYRSDTARAKSGTGGFGLGLSIAKKIVDLHHGTIGVNSRPGAGTIFTVELPQSQPE